MCPGYSEDYINVFLNVATGGCSLPRLMVREGSCRSAHQCPLAKRGLARKLSSKPKSRNSSVQGGTCGHGLSFVDNFVKYSASRWADTVAVHVPLCSIVLLFFL